MADLVLIWIRLNIIRTLMEKLELESLLSRLREAALFLVKGDALALGALFTLVSTFKLEPPQVLGVAMSYRWVLQAIGGLIALGLLYEAILTVSHGSDDLKKNQKIANLTRYMYFVFGLLQIFVLVWVLGFLAGYLGSMSDHA
jgi:hypothetical protein